MLRTFIVCYNKVVSLLRIGGSFNLILLLTLYFGLQHVYTLRAYCPSNQSLDCHKRERHLCKQSVCRLAFVGATCGLCKRVSTDQYFAHQMPCCTSVGRTVSTVVHRVYRHGVVCSCMIEYAWSMGGCLLTILITIFHFSVQVETVR